MHIRCKNRSRKQRVASIKLCTFPKGGEREARGGKPEHGFAGYFNECMNGFEYQAFGHMVAEGIG
jgi:hypothetical protein